MDAIVRHYGEPSLRERIMAALGDAGLDVDRLTAADLAPVDEFHIGGRAATERLVALADLAPGSHVLDIGCGIGGTARYLAASSGHTVTGIDLTPAYVEVAQNLTRMVGLDGGVTFRHADVTRLPFDSGSFDAAFQLHVGMNLADKAMAFAEVARVLRSGGVFAIYDITGAADAEVRYPVPWATSPADSFLATPDQYVTALEAAGFSVDHMDDRSGFARDFFARLRERTGPPPALGLHLLMGPESATTYGNMVDAVQAGRLALFEIVARPANPAHGRG